MEEKMDRIIHYLDQMNRRDRWRTIAGFFRGMIGLLPLLLFLVSFWYFYHNGYALLQNIMQQLAKLSTPMLGQEQIDTFLQQLSPTNLKHIMDSLH